MKKLLLVCLFFSGCLYRPELIDSRPRRATDWVNIDCGENYHRVEIVSHLNNLNMEYYYKCSNEHPWGVYLKMEE